MFKLVCFEVHSTRVSFILNWPILPAQSIIILLLDPRLGTSFQVGH